MSSNYPDGYDNLTARTDASTATPNAHAQDHTDERDAINAIETELGLAPSGAAATVRARLDTLDTTVDGKAAATHASQHQDGGADELALDASQTTTGNFNVARLGTGTPSAFTFLDGTGAWTDDVPVFVPVKNTSGATIAKGAPVYATGTVGATSVVEIALADADVTAKMPAIGLTTSELADNASGYVTVVGTVRGVDTSAYTVNQTLYVSTTPGVLTGTKPTGTTELIQGIGRVTRVASNGGEILVLGAGRTNDVPNAIDAEKLTAGTVDPARLGSGSSITTKFLRGDSTWQTITPGSVATDTIFDAKGDLPAGTDADAASRLAVGENGQMLFADSSEATGLKWAQFRSQALKFKTDDYWLMSRSSGASGYSAGTVGSSVTNSNNSAIYNPFSISEEISIKALALHCIATNPGANAVVRIGIYNADPTTGRPSTVLLDAGTTSINASNVKELTFDALTLKPGFYWYVVAVQGLDTSGTANPTFSACATSGSFQAAQETVVSASNNLFPTWFSGNNVTGAFAANPTFSVTRGLASKVFHLWAKVA